MSEFQTLSCRNLGRSLATWLSEFQYSYVILINLNITVSMLSDVQVLPRQTKGLVIGGVTV